MGSFEEFKRDMLNVPAVKAEYDALAPEFEAIRAEIEAAGDGMKAEYDFSQSRENPYTSE